MANRRNRRRRQRANQENNGSDQQTANNGQSPDEENKNNPHGLIVLRVFIHCQGCGNQVLKCLRGFEGVEEIEIDAKNHKVTVKGKKADPMKVAQRLRKKSGKHVELISPLPIKEEKKEEIKPQPKVIEVVLKIYIHCVGCAKEVKHCIHNMEGVQTVDPDMGKNLVRVKGTMDPQKLVEFINKRAGRHAEIVQNKKTGNANQNEGGNKEKNKKNECTTYFYPTQLDYAHLLFNDENPNSCYIM